MAFFHFFSGMLLLIYESIIWVLASFIRKKYCVNKTLANNWIISSNIMLAVFIATYFLFGGGLDHVNWVDTVSYYNHGIELADGSIDAVSYISEQEWPPHVGYDFFLGLFFFLFGDNVFAACLTNAFFSVISSYVLFRIGLFFCDTNKSLKIASIYVFLPLLVHFSFYLLKDISVMLLVEFVVLGFFTFQSKPSVTAFVHLIIPLLILFFYRSFYVVFLLIWFAFCVFIKERRSRIRKILFTGFMIIAFVMFVTILQTSGFNIGYTLGGEGSALPFLPQTRVSLNWASISNLISLILANARLFISTSIKAISRVFVGPFYWMHWGNQIYLQETGRFILFENLTSIYELLLLAIALLTGRRRNNYYRKCLRSLITIFVASLLLVGDIRWKVSLLPYYILLLLDNIIRTRQTKGSREDNVVHMEGTPRKK